jgi:hypothetical protein
MADCMHDRCCRPAVRVVAGEEPTHKQFLGQTHDCCAVHSVPPRRKDHDVKSQARFVHYSEYTHEQYQAALKADAHVPCRQCDHTKAQHYSAGPTCMDVRCPCTAYIPVTYRY